MKNKMFFSGSRIFILLTLCLSVSFLLAVQIQRPEATSPDGLKVTGFSFSASELKVGQSFAITFRLHNVTDHDIQFHPSYGVFVGTRCGNENRDFGHRAKGQVLHPGANVPLKARGVFNNAGTWTFWPAYNVDNHWGPFKWNAIVVDVTE